jgi:hypothetical protein
MEGLPRMSRTNKQLALIFVAVIVVGVVVYLAAERAATDQATQNYDNQIASCEAGNPVREAVVLATQTASETAHPIDARPLYATATQKILRAPFVEPTGARDCQKAIKEP